MNHKCTVQYAPRVSPKPLTEYLTAQENGEDGEEKLKLSLNQSLASHNPLTDQKSQLGREEIESTELFLCFCSQKL